MKEREMCIKKTDKGSVNCWMVVIGRFKLQLWMRLVYLNYNFKWEWLAELPDNKLSDNLASELVEISGK